MAPDLVDQIMADRVKIAGARGKPHVLRGLMRLHEAALDDALAALEGVQEPGERMRLTERLAVAAAAAGEARRRLSEGRDGV